MPQLQA